MMAPTERQIGEMADTILLHGLAGQILELTSHLGAEPEDLLVGLKLAAEAIQQRIGRDLQRAAVHNMLTPRR